MAINLTGLIPLRYLSRMSAASSSLHFSRPGIAVHNADNRSHANADFTILDDGIDTVGQRTLKQAMTVPPPLLDSN